MLNHAHPWNVFRSQNVYIPLRVDGGGGKCTQYNLYAAHKSHMNSYTTLYWLIRGGFSSVTLRWSALFLLVNTGCGWLIFIPRGAKLSANRATRFLILNGNVIRTGLSDGVWTGSVVCWWRLIAESMRFSGYFNFKNMCFKFLYSCKRKSCVDDNF